MSAGCATRSTTASGLRNGVNDGTSTLKALIAKMPAVLAKTRTTASSSACGCRMYWRMEAASSR